MRNAVTSFLAIVLLAFAPAFAHAADNAKPQAFTDAQKAAIEDIIKNYLTQEHPETVMEAVQELQKRQQAEADTQSQKAITANHDKIYDDPDTPVGGNPKGKVTVVEFFDYQCPYCKSSHPGIEQLLKTDKNVKFIFKDFPILGPTSTEAAKAALASVKQGKYLAYQDALMQAPFSHNAHPDQDIALIYSTAEKVGLNVDKLKKDMQSDKIKKIVEANVALGQEIGVRGTPMFIVGDKTYPGAMQYEMLKQAVDEAAKK